MLQDPWSFGLWHGLCFVSMIAAAAIVGILEALKSPRPEHARAEGFTTAEVACVVTRVGLGIALPCATACLLVAHTVCTTVAGTAGTAFAVVALGYVAGWHSAIVTRRIGWEWSKVALLLAGLAVIIALEWAIGGVSY